MAAADKGKGGTRRRAGVGVFLIGMFAGVLALLGFDFGLAATSTDEFCVGCHNHAIPEARYQLTAHYRNRHGLSAGCSDCHVQKEFLPKMRRKIEASREVWGHLRGIIDSDEKYLAHQDAMRERELVRFRSSDSATCRSCHDPARMDTAAQSPKARRDHARLNEGKTCVDCHEDAGHAMPAADPEQSEAAFDF